MNRLILPLIVLTLFGLLASSAVAQESDVPLLIEQLMKDEMPGQRRAAARKLGMIGPKAQKAVPALVKALKDVDSGVRNESQSALTKIGEPAVDAVIETIKDPDEFVRLRAVQILGAIGPDAKAAISVLEKAQDDPSSFVSEAAKEAVFRVKVDTKTVTMLLKDKDKEKRLYAVRAVAFLGQHAKSLVPALSDLLKQEKNEEVRQEVPKTLGKIGKDVKEAIPVLSTALTDKDATVRLNAILALGELGPDARSALPAIDKAVKTNKSDDEFVNAARVAWTKINKK